MNNREDDDSVYGQFTSSTTDHYIGLKINTPGFLIYSVSAVPVAHIS